MSERGKQLLAAKGIKMVNSMVVTKHKHKTDNVILAIDPAEKTGWAISQTIYGVWNFKLKRDENFGMKLIRLRSKLKEAVEEHNVAIIIYERPTGIMPNALISHSKLVGVIEEFCTERDIPFRGYSAHEIKKFATGKGAGKKELLMVAAKEKLGYTGNDDNEVDAIWLLLMAKKDLGI